MKAAKALLLSSRNANLAGPNRVTFDSVLIANRGEIACRIVRAVQSLGLRAIAVYSDADADAPHVAMADAAVRIGTPPATDSYLNVGNILRAAQVTGAEAVHPGYGFLAENAAFAQACLAAGMTFIGPPPAAIELMGDKAAAKRHMQAAGVSCVPGYHGHDLSDAELIKAAAEIGFPLMVKAAAGGGGRGMRLVDSANDLGDALRIARSEAASAFGSDELILEKAIIRPRHVEIQVLADAHGNFVHLGERDCSVQRRHQKVIEEAPGPGITSDLRQQMGQAAVAAAMTIEYQGAGTVEFLLDESGAFYFLEMNTRLQVEHPVTEAVTGRDLVAWQIRIAAGEPLKFRQQDVSFDGHAIEARLYAEDPADGFRPSAGRVFGWYPPVGPGIRTDAGIESGLEVSSFYDPMLAKLVAWGETREVARRRLLKALSETCLFGPRTNRDFLIACLQTATFKKGLATTALIAETFGDASAFLQAPTEEHAAVAAVLDHQDAARVTLAKSVAVAPVLQNWSSRGPMHTHYSYASGGREFDAVVTTLGKDDYAVSIAGKHFRIGCISNDGVRAELRVDGHKCDAAYFVRSPHSIQVFLGHREATFMNRLQAAASETASISGRVLAPMHGRLQDLFVQPGDRVSVGTRLVVLEAMKMQHEMRAEIDGVVTAINFAAGEQLAAGDPILEIKPPDDSESRPKGR